MPFAANLLGLLRQARSYDRLVVIAGNGGSLVNALHFELHLQANGVRAISLTNPAILSAYASDYGLEQTFAPSVSALGREADVFIAISGSGTEPSILRAVKVASARKMTIVGISFIPRAKLLDMVHLAIRLNSPSIHQFEDDLSQLSHLFGLI